MLIERTRPEDILFSPADVVRLGMENLNHRRTHKDSVIPLGLDSIDNGGFLPLLPGDLVSVIARPGNGKTSFMLRWAKYRSNWLVANGINDRVVIYVTAEQTVEELYSYGVAAETKIDLSELARGNISDGEWNRIEKAGMAQAGYSLWLIGNSKENGHKRPVITPLTLEDTIFYLKETTGKKADMVFIDYLQLIKDDNKKPESKVVSMGNVQESLKTNALHTLCPWVVAVQAKREVDIQKLPIPGMDSGQWTSTTEQYSDKIISLTRPCKYRKQGEDFGSVIVKGHSQMLVSLLKQKMGIDNVAWWVNFNPAYNELHELEYKYDLDKINL